MYYLILKTNSLVFTAHRDYVTFEFLAKGARYTRHTLGIATVANGKLILMSTGANERRWGAMKEKLEYTVKSFKAFNTYSSV